MPTGMEGAATSASPATVSSPLVAGYRSQTTRVLHLFLLLVVVHQLINSLFIERPMPGDDPDLSYLLHEWVGLAGVAVVALFWGWTAIRAARETQLSVLFPWLTASGWRAVFGDVIGTFRELLSGKAPSDTHEALASAVHGLGLVIVTIMVASGATWFFLEGTAYARPVLILHKMTANLMWAYLIVHAGTAVMHHFLGSDILSRMFWLKSAPRAFDSSDGDI